MASVDAVWPGICKNGRQELRYIVAPISDAGVPGYTENTEAWVASIAMYRRSYLGCRCDWLYRINRSMGGQHCDISSLLSRKEQPKAMQHAIVPMVVNRTGDADRTCTIGSSHTRVDYLKDT